MHDADLFPFSAVLNEDFTKREEALFPSVKENCIVKETGGAETTSIRVRNTGRLGQPNCTEIGNNWV
jgi:hypothetical protein